MYDKEDFRANKPAVIKHYEKKGFESLTDFSALTGVPIIVVYEYVKEDFPELGDMIDKRIKSIKDFFRIK